MVKVKTVNVPELYLDRVKNLLENLATEQTGWRRFLSRWKISQEPLRADSESLLKEILRAESRREITKGHSVDVHVSRAG